MIPRPGRLLVIPLFFALAALFSCATPQEPKKRAPVGKLAVASFHGPGLEWHFEGSGDSMQQKDLPDRVLRHLTKELLAQLKQRGYTALRKPDSVDRCREVVLSRQPATSANAEQYWARVGRCVSADSILVPQLLRWRQRVGGGWGVERPARVTFRLVWLDPRQKRVVRAFYFDEEQKSLAENVLEIGSFIERGGRWVSAEQLAAEGIRRGLEDMGL